MFNVGVKQHYLHSVHQQINDFNESFVSIMIHYLNTAISVTDDSLQTFSQETESYSLLAYLYEASDRRQAGRQMGGRTDRDR